MNATTHDALDPAARRHAARTGALLLLGVVVVTVLMRKIGPLTMTLVYGVALVGAAGTIGMARLVRRTSGYPRWALWTTAGVMTGALLLSVPLADSPAAWLDDMHLTVWLFPWFILLMGTADGRRAGICSSAHPRSGWMMVSAGLILAGTLLAANPIAGWISALFRAH